MSRGWSSVGGGTEVRAEVGSVCTWQCWPPAFTQGTGLEATNTGTKDMTPALVGSQGGEREKGGRSSDSAVTYDCSVPGSLGH